MAQINNKTEWEWVPRVSIGQFKIGTSILDYAHDYNFVTVEEYRKILWGVEDKIYRSSFSEEDEFLIPQYDFSFILYTKNGLIDHFQVETYLFYKGQDIIASSLDEVLEIIDCVNYDKKESQEIIDNIQQIYYFYDLGLTLWTLDDKVITAFCDNGEAWKQ